MAYPIPSVVSGPELRSATQQVPLAEGRARSTEITSLRCIPNAQLLMVPFGKAVLGATFPTLLEQARAGAHVVRLVVRRIDTESARGPRWPDIEPIFGAQHRLSYGLADPR